MSAKKKVSKAAVAKYLAAALKRVESESIRKWVRSESNYPIWLEIAENGAIKNGVGEESEMRLCSYIVCVAIGA